MSASPEVNTIDYLDHLVKYFNRISSLWEGCDGAPDPGTVICSKIIDNLNALKREPQALGIKTVPAVSEYPTGGKKMDMFHETGEVTYLKYQHGRLLTNAAIERINGAICTQEPRSIVLQIGNQGKWVTNDIELEIKLSAADRGFAGINFRDGHPVEGKFVFLKDGTFFLFDGNITHSDVLHLVGVTDRVAVLSAGFAYIYETDISLHGTSVSLDCGPRFDGYDLKKIAEHLRIPLKVEA